MKFLSSLTTGSKSASFWNLKLRKKTKKRCVKTVILSPARASSLGDKVGVPRPSSPENLFAGLLSCVKFVTKGSAVDRQSKKIVVLTEIVTRTSRPRPEITEFITSSLAPAKDDRLCSFLVLFCVVLVFLFVLVLFVFLFFLRFLASSEIGVVTLRWKVTEKLYCFSLFRTCQLRVTILNSECHTEQKSKSRWSKDSVIFSCNWIGEGEWLFSCYLKHAMSPGDLVT